jgi:hypothetical protein
MPSAAGVPVNSTQSDAIWACVSLAYDNMETIGDGRFANGF